ncbi:MAG: hypothetical protein ACRCXZ_08565 [Patescibacteria group bacterium]
MLPTIVTEDQAQAANDQYLLDNIRAYPQNVFQGYFMVESSQFGGQTYFDLIIPFTNVGHPVSNTGVFPTLNQVINQSGQFVLLQVRFDSSAPENHSRVPMTIVAVL